MIEKSVRLACTPSRAFELLTEQAGAWWPRERRHTTDPHSVIRIEASGRFYERAADGTEVELGVVRVFSPPGIKKGPRGRFAMYVPPVLEALGLAEVEHLPKNNRMRAK